MLQHDIASHVTGISTQFLEAEKNPSSCKVEVVTPDTGFQQNTTFQSVLLLWSTPVP